MMPVLLAVLAACAPDPAPQDRPPDAAPPTDSTDAPPADTPDEPDTVSDDRAPADLTVLASLPCADPVGTWSYDVAWALDDGTPPGGRVDSVARFEGGGFAVADVDGNGLDDLLLPGEDRTRLRLQVAPRQFVDADDRLPEAAPQGVGALLADLDADGDPDAVVTRWTQPARVWRNDTGRFVDVTDAWGFTETFTGRTTTAATPSDMDGDGDLDLFLGAFGRWEETVTPDLPRPSRLYEQVAPGAFLDVSDRLPEAVQQGFVFAARWLDIDADGDLDLRTVHDFGGRGPNALARNDGTGHFVDVALDLGLAHRIDGMGLDVAYDAVGPVEIVEAGWSVNRFAVRQASGSWYDSYRTLGLIPDGLRDQEVGWSTSFVDLDLDADLDVVQAFGKIHGFPAGRVQPDAFFLRGDDGTFTQRIPSLEPVGDETRALLATDLDGDGWLDLVRREVVGPTRVWSRRCDRSRWLSVVLRQAGPNPDAIGAVVRVNLPDGRALFRPVDVGGSGLLSSVPPRAHFGLDDAETVEVEVRWPDGQVTRNVGVATAQRIALTRP